MAVSIPDDRAFASFKAECVCEEGWSLTYNKGSITVWTQGLEEGKSVHKMKVRTPRLTHRVFRSGRRSSLRASKRH